MGFWTRVRLPSSPSWEAFITLPFLEGEAEGMEDQRIAEGYFFLSEEDAETARQEKKKIDYLEKHMDYNSAHNVLRVYKKAMAENVFKTPVGYDYLKKIRDYLLSSPQVKEEEIPPVALSNYYNIKRRTGYTPVHEKNPPVEKNKPQWPLISLIANVLLVAAVIAMFIITAKSDNPNILNYETKLLNKYAAWEQELTERERVIRERERELQINVD